MTAMILLGVLLSLLVSIHGYSPDAKKYLLPGNIVPTDYDLQFYPAMDSFRGNNMKIFVGFALITMVTVQDYVSTIVLNCKSPLTVNEAVLLRNWRLPVSLGRGVYNEETEKVMFRLRSPLKKNEKFRIHISFVGEHMLEQKGFFYLPTTQGNASSFLLVTHLQPNNARLVFPCFDEPKYKALVKISVGIPREFFRMGYRVLTNTEEESVNLIGGTYVFRFKTTPLPISTYLVAMSVSTNKSTPRRYVNSTYPGSSYSKPKAVRAWTTPDLLDKAELLQSFGQAVIDIFTREFGIEYGLDKLHQFIMNSFLSDMENWDLIMYRERILTDNSRSKAAQDIAHETSHQWFGNLVTTHSWTDIWLNEAFAMYFEFFAAEKINVPEMDGSAVKYSFSYVVENLQGSALNEDSFDYTHPLTINVYEPSQMWCYFDAIEYKKGSSLLRMMEHVLGEEAFYKALRYYLMINKENVTTPSDLLSAFDYVSKESKSDLQGRLPSEILRDWHLQEGYPVVQMQYNKNSIVLTQESFRISDSKKFASHKWNIPISYSTNVHSNFTDTRALQWLWKEKPSLEITIGPDVQWIVINNLETGFYRVNYPLSNWISLFEVLRNADTMEQIHELNRAQIIDDAANLARSTSKDFLPYSFFMNLTTYLENETSYFAWKSALNNFDYLFRMLSKSHSSYPLFKKHILKIARKQLKALSLISRSDDTYQQHQLRSELVTRLSRMGDSEYTKEIVKLVNESSNNTVPGYLKASAHCLEVSTGDDTFSQNLFDKYLKTDNISDKLSIISALACTRNEDILVKLLKTSVSPDETVTNNERSKIFDAIHEARPENTDLLLNFLYNYTFEVYMRYGQRKNFDLLLKKLAKGLGSDEELLKLKQLGTKIQYWHPMVVQCKSTMPIVLDIAKTNNLWLKKRSRAVSEWLFSEYLVEKPSRSIFKMAF